MEPLGDVGHVESLFLLFGDSVSVSASYKHSLFQMSRQLRNRFGHTR
jgi:hypothetical protein